jgi:hypothetical protein
MRAEACKKFRLIRRIYSGDGYRDYYVFKLDGFPVTGKIYRHDVRFFKVWDLDVCMDYYLLRIRRVKRKFDSRFFASLYLIHEGRMKRVWIKEYQCVNDVNAIERTIRRIIRNTVDYIVKERYRESHANW